MSNDTEIGATTFFDRLGEEDRAAMCDLGTVRSFEKGESLFFEGDRSGEVFVLLDGEVKILVSATDGREIVLAIRGVGEILGELASIDDTERSATVTTLGACECLVLTADQFRGLLDNRIGITRLVLQSLAERSRDLSVRHLEFGVDDAIGRVCRRLTELGERYGSEGDHGDVVIDSPLSQGDIAAWSGLSRQAVVKALQSLRRLGWIESDAGVISVLDRSAVANRASMTVGDRS
ncbi:MAG: Crp/Fnr family transcriptional regulator [Acidimicrobiales bacterium]